MGGQRHTLAALPPGKTQYPLYRRLGGRQSRSGRVRKISPSPGFDPGTVQAVASRYTDFAIQAHRQYVYCIYTVPHASTKMCSSHNESTNTLMLCGRQILTVYLPCKFNHQKDVLCTNSLNSAESGKNKEANSF